MLILLRILTIVGTSNQCGPYYCVDSVDSSKLNKKVFVFVGWTQYNNISYI